MKSPLLHHFEKQDDFPNIVLGQSGRYKFQNQMFFVFPNALKMLNFNFQTSSRQFK